ncbi:hypothetical protein KXS11_03505 [Plantibacter flavus]|uniref:hypothetical protein n=1 Tax=Plantibacter flavus TaxID=150123 RepID=UPI003F170488
MFGRRRHAAPVSASKLTEKQLFDLVHARLASELGANGAWVLSRRTPTSGDEIFHEVYAQQLAHEIATDIDLEQAAVTVRATEAPSRGWRLWGRQTDEAEALEDTTVEVPAEAVIDESSEVPAAPEAEAETDVEETEATAGEAVADEDPAGEAFTEPTFVERTLLEPQHYPITVWAEPEFIDASLVNPVPARRSAVS